MVDVKGCASMLNIEFSPMFSIKIVRLIGSSVRVLVVSDTEISLADAQEFKPKIRMENIKKIVQILIE
jgi:hypothetical protein